MLKNVSIPLLGFAAYSGTGKTTLLEQLIPRFTIRGLRVGVVKHAHHDFDIDHPGKDSYRLRHAGAKEVIVASGRRWALIHENEATNDNADPSLDEMISHLDQTHLDLILVEGFKHIAFSRIELHRPSLGHALLFPKDPSIIAIATDRPIEPKPPITEIDLNNIDAIVDFIERHLSLRD